MYSLKQNGKLLKLWLYINNRRNTKNSWPLFAGKAAQVLIWWASHSFPWFYRCNELLTRTRKLRYSIVIGSQQSINWSGYNSLSAPLTKSESLRDCFPWLARATMQWKPPYKFLNALLNEQLRMFTEREKRKLWEKSKQTQRISGISEKCFLSGISTPVSLKSLQRTTNTQLSN